MLFEVDEAATRIREEADPDANIIVGASFDESLEGIVRVSVVATGIDNLDPARQTPNQRKAHSRNSPAGCATTAVATGGADRIERSAPLPQLECPPLRPMAPHPEGRPEKPVSEYAAHAAPQGLAPYGRSSRVRNSIEETVSRDPGLPAPQGQLRPS